MTTPTPTTEPSAPIPVDVEAQAVFETLSGPQRFALDYVWRRWRESGDTFNGCTFISGHRRRSAECLVGLSLLSAVRAAAKDPCPTCSRAYAEAPPRYFVTPLGTRVAEVADVWRSFKRGSP